jgi:hypothetical protein
MPMDHELSQALSHVLWIGGATDTGKTTISHIISERYGLQVYNYDRHDLPQMKRLAGTSPRYRRRFESPREWVMEWSCSGGEWNAGVPFGGMRCILKGHEQDSARADRRICTSTDR